MAEKKVYPFNDGHFDFQIEGAMVRGCKYPPKLAFKPTSPDAKKPGIYFNGYYNHENMERPASQLLSLDNFRYFLNVLKAVANAPGEGQIVKQLAFKFFKDKEFKHSGTSCGIVRNEKGLIYIAFKNKAWPTIPFNMLPHGSMEQQTKDGELEDVREVSQMATLTYVERWTEMLNRTTSNAIELDTGSSGGSSSSSYSSKPSYGSSNSSGGSTESVDESFDDTIPF